MPAPATERPSAEEMDSIRHYQRQHQQKHQRHSMHPHQRQQRLIAPATPAPPNYQPGFYLVFTMRATPPAAKIHSSKLVCLRTKSTALENEVFGQIIEYYSESEIDQEQIIKALKKSIFGKWIDGDILKPKMVGEYFFIRRKIIHGNDLEIVFFVFRKSYCV